MPVPPVPNGLLLWCSASDLAGLPAESTVTLWPDRSGNGHPAVPDSGAIGGMWRPDRQVPSVQFSLDSGRRMTFAPLFLPANSDLTCYCVAALEGPIFGADYAGMLEDTTRGPTWARGSNNIEAAWAIGGSIGVDHVPQPSRWYIYRLRVKGWAGELAVDGVPLGVIGQLSLPREVSIGRLGNTSLSPATRSNWISDIRIWPRALDDWEDAAVMYDIRQRYGL